ncbi:hypothetical protein BH11PSE1_BH11PSE1_06440 [soil metagenome]
MRRSLIARRSARAGTRNTNFRFYERLKHVGTESLTT